MLGPTGNPTWRSSPVRNSISAGYYCKNHDSDEELMRLAKYLKQLATAATSGTPELNTGHQRWREKVHLGVALVVTEMLR